MGASASSTAKNDPPPPFPTADDPAGSSFATPGRKVVVSLADRITPTTLHFEPPLAPAEQKGTKRHLPQDMTPEQAAVQAEVDPATLKVAIATESRRQKLKSSMIDTIELDLMWGCCTAAFVGAFAVPLTKFAVDQTEANRYYYQETKATASHSVYTVRRKGAEEAAKEAAAAAEPKKMSVAGSTFQSFVAQRKMMLPVGHALEKMRAQQLRLGFFSIWRGTGAEMFWFLTSCGGAMACQVAADRFWNRDWYIDLTAYNAAMLKKTKTKNVDTGVLEGFDSNPLAFDRRLPLGSNPVLHSDHRWNIYFTQRRSFFEGFCTGAAGGAVSVFATHHAEIVAQKCVEDYDHALKTGARRQFSSILDCYMKTQQQHGVISLYVGIGPVFARAAAFWGLTYAIRNSLLDACGYVRANDYVRMMKRKHYDLPSSEHLLFGVLPSASAASRADGNKDKELDLDGAKGKSWVRFLTGAKGLRYAGHDFYVAPMIFNAAFGAAAAAVARDAGAVLVRYAVTAKGAATHLATSAFVQARSGDLTLPKDLWADCATAGRNLAGSTVPKRLPFSCVRIGVVMAVFDSMRAAHTRRWCSEVALEHRTADAQKYK